MLHINHPSLCDWYTVTIKLTQLVGFIPTSFSISHQKALHEIRSRRSYGTNMNAKKMLSKLFPAGKSSQTINYSRQQAHPDVSKRATAIKYRGFQTRTRSKARSFHLFPQLPRHIRRQIWRDAQKLSSRIVFVATRLPEGHNGSSDFENIVAWNIHPTAIPFYCWYVPSHVKNCYHCTQNPSWVI